MCFFLFSFMVLLCFVIIYAASNLEIKPEPHEATAYLHQCDHIYGERRRVVRFRNVVYTPSLVKRLFAYSRLFDP
jgi:hypothetical protein